MKKTFIVVMLVIGILPELCAQSSKENEAFKIPDNIVLTKRFYIDLGQGNKLTIELTDLTDLQRIGNIDSVLSMFLNDIKPLKDSLSDPLAAKRIDYVIDAQGRRKIRTQQFRQPGNDYLVRNGELSALKINQDTINIIGIIPNPPKAETKISLKNPRYFHLLFYLNNMEELQGYMNGPLATKIATIENDKNSKWPLVLGSGYHYLKADKTITADNPYGVIPGRAGDALELMQSVNIQNYKSYFVPSFSLGVQLMTTNRERTFKWQPALFWEPHFLFSRDAQGKLKTYRNDFLTFTYGQGGTTDHDPRKDFSFSAVFSIGYLIHQSGDFIEKNTFRLGAGKIHFLKTTIEPSVYFSRFFKGVTPGIRISQSF